MLARSECDTDENEVVAATLSSLPVEIIIKIFLLLAEGEGHEQSYYQTRNRSSGAVSCTCTYFYSAISTLTPRALGGYYYWANAQAMLRLYDQFDNLPDFLVLNARINRISNYISGLNDINDNDLYCLTGNIALIDKVFSALDNQVKGNYRDGYANAIQRYLFLIAISENAEAFAYFIKKAGVSIDQLVPDTNVNTSLRQFFSCLCLLGTEGAWKAVLTCIPAEAITKFMKYSDIARLISREFQSKHSLTPESLRCFLRLACPNKNKYGLDEICFVAVSTKRLNMIACFADYMQDTDYTIPLFSWIQLNSHEDEAMRCFIPEKYPMLTSRYCHIKLDQASVDHLEILPDAELKSSLLDSIFTHEIQEKTKKHLISLIEYNSLNLLKCVLKRFPQYLDLIHQNDDELGYQMMSATFIHSKVNHPDNCLIYFYLLNELKINVHTKHNINQPIITKAVLAANALLVEYLKLVPNHEIINEEYISLTKKIYKRYRDTYYDRHGVKPNLVANLATLIKAGMNPQNLIHQYCTQLSFYDSGIYSLRDESNFGQLIEVAIEAGLNIQQVDESGTTLCHSLISNDCRLGKYSERVLEILINSLVNDGNYHATSCINEVFASLCIDGPQKLLALIISKGVDIHKDYIVYPNLLKKHIKDPCDILAFDALFTFNSGRPEGFTVLDMAIVTFNIEAMETLLQAFPREELERLCTTPRLFEHTLTTYDMTVQLGNEKMNELLSRVISPYRSACCK